MKTENSSIKQEEGTVASRVVETKPTPELSADFTLPLRADRSAVYDTIYDAEDRLVAFISIADDNQAWMRFMVNAVNSHAQLCRALKDITEQMRQFSDDEHVIGCEPLIEAADGALALAHGQATQRTKGN